MKCGAPKIPGGGNIYCQECHDLQQWAQQTKRAYRPPRPCAKCGAVVVKGVGRKWCDDCRALLPSCQRCFAKPVRAKRKKLCEECYVISQDELRIYRLEWNRNRMKDPANKEKMRIQAREYRKLRAKDATRMALINESRRIWWRNAHGSKPVSEEKYKKGNGRYSIRTQLPASPLVPFIADWLEQNPVTVKGLTVPSMQKLATISGVNDKRLRHILEGKITSVRMSDADKVCIAMETTLDWVYDRQISKDGDLCA